MAHRTGFPLSLASNLELEVSDNLAGTATKFVPLDQNAFVKAIPVKRLFGQEFFDIGAGRERYKIGAALP